MMRSGAIHCCSNASVYLATSDKKLEFEDLYIKKTLRTTEKSAKNLQNEVEHLYHNYAESAEYFRVSLTQCICKKNSVNKIWIIYFCFSYLLTHFRRLFEMTKIHT